MFSFFQTLLWVGLIVWALRRYEDAVRALVDALTKRVRDGSEVKFGALGLGAVPTPLPVQKERLEAEVRASDGEESPSRAREAGQDPPEAQSPQHSREDVEAAQPRPGKSGLGMSSLSTELVLKSYKHKSWRARDIWDAETLGLRYLGAELGKAVVPNISLAGRPVDGVVMSNADGCPDAVVEVKYVPSVAQSRRVAEQLRTLVLDVGFLQQRESPSPLPLVAVVVVPTDSMEAKVRDELLLRLDQSRRLERPLQLHVYSLARLRRAFGLEEPDAGQVEFPET